MQRKKGLLIGFVVGLLGGLLFAPVLARPGTNSWEKWKNEFFDPLQFAIGQIEGRYVEEVKPEDLLIGAYHGVLSRLDRYSNYIPPDRLEEFQGDTKGKFGGLGIQIRFLPLEKVLKVEQPIPGTPAFRKGVLAGDIIVHIKEESTGKEHNPSDFEDVHDAVRILRGKPNSKVTITVVHKESREQEKITIPRAVIKIPGVKASRIVDEGYKIGYVYVANFHEDTASDLKKKLKELHEQGMRGLVIDLRFNPGGLLKSAIDVSDLFLGDAVVVSTHGRADPERIYRTHSKDTLGDAPIIVLMNSYSASASEIVAGAIKDNGRGLLVGETTFGKGSVQTILPLRNKKSALKLTTSKYYTPSGVCIEEKGIKPHIEVSFTDEQNRRLIQNLAEESGYPEDEKQPEQENPSESDTENDKEQEGEDSGEKEEEFRDTQLQRAIDILKGIIIERKMHPKAL
ncbi:MAG: S41 family peptidase [Candidatus Brocadiia bacterium]